MALKLKINANGSANVEGTDYKADKNGVIVVENPEHVSILRRLGAVDLEKKVETIVKKVEQEVREVAGGIAAAAEKVEDEIKEGVEEVKKEGLLNRLFGNKLGDKPEAENVEGTAGEKTE